MFAARLGQSRTTRVSPGDTMSGTWVCASSATGTSILTTRPRRRAAAEKETTASATSSVVTMDLPWHSMFFTRLPL